MFVSRYLCVLCVTSLKLMAGWLVGWRPTRMPANGATAIVVPFDKKTHSFLMVFAICNFHDGNEISAHGENAKRVCVRRTHTIYRRMAFLVLTIDRWQGVCVFTRKTVCRNRMKDLRHHHHHHRSCTDSLRRPTASTSLHSRGCSICSLFDGLLARKFVLHAQTVRRFVICM